MQGARHSLLFLPLPPRAPGVLPFPAAAPLLLPAQLPPRGTNDLDQASRLLVSRVRFTNDVLKAVKNVLANLPSPSEKYVRRPRFNGAGFPDLLALLERLVRRADAISLAAILAAALLLYVLRRWAAEGAAAAADDEEEANGISTSGRLPASTRRRLLMMALQLVPRGAGAGARRAPRAWDVRHAFDSHTAAAAALQPGARGAPHLRWEEDDRPAPSCLRLEMFHFHADSDSLVELRHPDADGPEANKFTSTETSAPQTRLRAELDACQ